MKEVVGECSVCGKEILCMDGFLNGVISKHERLYCFDCANPIEHENSNS
ncbi:hypothetical protein J2S78_001937 [Salibacterium salarium]|nr:hypothetical protein [Salibacterium salarium]MDQ0299517.1 hypothetical protein [Salibacterium salarium]